MITHKAAVSEQLGDGSSYKGEGDLLKNLTLQLEYAVWPQEASSVLILMLPRRRVFKQISYTARHHVQRYDCSTAVP